MLAAVKIPRLGNGELVIERPPVAAADARLDALFAARAALKRAYTLRQAAELQVDQLRALVDRLEREMRP